MTPRSLKGKTGGGRDVRRSLSTPLPHCVSAVPTTMRVASQMDLHWQEVKTQAAKQGELSLPFDVVLMRWERGKDKRKGGI